MTLQENKYDYNAYLDNYINIHFCKCVHNTTCSLCSDTEDSDYEGDDYEGDDCQDNCEDNFQDNCKDNNTPYKEPKKTNSYFSGNTFIYLGAIATLGFSIYKFFRK